MDDSSSISRRSTLSGVAGLLVGTAGCSRTGGEQSEPVSMLAAGSLNNGLENGLRPSVDAPLQIESRGSTEVARLAAEGQKDPDIVSLADIALFDSSLESEWVAEFATNAIVLAYNPDTAGGKRLAGVGPENWYRPVLNGDVEIGRTDPDLDPLGYRTLFMLELATEYYGTDANLRETIPLREQIYPETQLISQFETGSIDAAIAYRNMAVERGYEYIDLPTEIDLSDPAYADTYATTSYELPDGTVARGRRISYGSTVRRESPPVFDVFRTHTTGQYLTDFGFVVPDDYPQFTGTAPDEVTH
ncbi:extracellular solute-binding protein [Natrialba sp. PRR66]|uniref:extracellular solute-binding protein n=1 Tax=Natrialba sp. PRR66 TaxID=3098146 RepID=UPI002B1DA5D2|nr:extracellular solute-binding protein [Natrialba sp. PRR66]